jgi:hypothetical protein
MSKPQQHQLLYLLTALLLLMQSFAVWHDAEHAFHSQSEQCERLEAFANNPSLDLVPLIAEISTVHTVVINAFLPVARLWLTQHNTYTIRAPPVLFSYRIL